MNVNCYRVFGVLILLFLSITQPALAKMDAQLSCDELIVEAESTEKAISELGGQANSERMGKVGMNAGVAAADMAGHHVPFLGETVGAIGGLMSFGQKSREQKLQDAYARRNMLNGIYMGKGCPTA